MFNQVANKETVAATKTALEKNGFKVLLAENGEEAKKMALELIPQQAEVLTMTSITLETIGLAKELNESGNYNSARAKLNEMSADKSNSREMKRLGAAPEYATGSVHAITEDGKLIIASNTGSQLAAYVYGAGKVIFVAGTQKIVKDEQTGLDRIHEHIFPLESARARKAYGLPDSFNTYDSKVLKIQREVTPERITVILVNEVLGF